MTLFQRRPFALTPPGEKLYEFIQPLFANLDKMTAELQGGQARHIRIGASTIVLRDHLPQLLRSVQKKFRALKVSLREGYQADLEKLLNDNEIDLAITVIEKKTAAGFRSLELLQLPLQLLVEKNSDIKSAEQLWQRDKIGESLICLPASESVTRSFLKQLAKRGVEWFPSIEASSLDLIETYVANGLGVGMSVAVPKKPLPENVRALPLPEFPPLVIGALWRGKATPLLEMFLSEAKLRARELS